MTLLYRRMQSLQHCVVLPWAADDFANQHRSYTRFYICNVEKNFWSILKCVASAQGKLHFITDTAYIPCRSVRKNVHIISIRLPIFK